MSQQFDKNLLKKTGEDVFISRSVEIRRPELFEIGSHSAIDTGFYCTTAAQIGDYVHIGPYTTVIGGATGLLKMDHFAGFSAGCRIVCATDEYLGEGLTGPMIPKELKGPIEAAPVICEKFSLLGTNVVVLPGVTLAEGSVIGANSLVTKSTEPWTIYVGSPARAIKVRRRDKIIENAKRLGY
jgi:galactoside O-acetyltransferase